MAQINALVNAARAVVQTTSSAVGVSAANANLVAVAGALSGMQLSGYEVISPQMFVSVPSPDDAMGLPGPMAGGNSRSIPSPFQYPGADQNIFDSLVDPNATLDFQNFFFAQPTFIAAAEEFNVGDYLLESNSLYDPSQPDGSAGPDAFENHNANKKADAAAEGGGSVVDSSQGDIASGFNSILSNTQGGIAKAAGTAASGINYASSASEYGYGAGSGFLVEPNGYIYASHGSGDVVQGSAYADTLFGSTAGGDTLIGGAGNDTYAIYASTTQMIEVAGGGSHDTAYIGVDNYQGTSGVERIIALNTQSYLDHAATSGPYLAGIDSGWHINGSVDAQTLVGAYGADILNGGGGADLLIGGAGDDVYMYSGSETIVEQSNQGRDIVKASTSVALANNIEVGLADSAAGDLNIIGNDLDNLLVGNSAANNLSGGSGADTLVGNGGDDIYSGGIGADTFILNSQDSFMGEITDFHSGEDHLGLINSDPSITLSMAPNTGFTGVAGEILLVDGSLQVDWNGDAMFDSVLLINEAPTLADISIIDPNHTYHF
ncbi:calcium-binding protein [Polynucleobacter sp. UB-Piko-W3]|uniref:calcium-binding protein n=1 Tax=Polynucleobacter sp. UB-Piko-W3 TaxID=1819735 RepID=UPI001C0CADA3|nr:calcium-binding protein [Polynucleobacter sp. UB-Piko-W3]MBU3553990.1 calcium-binding protein [Polynucleobacter sp. UB-Piko-W3]